jgi:hypothetical protein
MTPLPFPARRKPSRWRRIGLLWTDLPIPVRMAIVLAAFVLIACLSGCTHFSHFRGDIDILTEDANACSIDPHPKPGCVVGVMVYGKWHFF